MFARRLASSTATWPVPSVLPSSMSTISKGRSSRLRDSQISKTVDSMLAASLYAITMTDTSQLCSWVEPAADTIKTIERWTPRALPDRSERRCSSHATARQQAMGRRNSGRSSPGQALSPPKPGYRVGFLTANSTKCQCSNGCGLGLSSPHGESTGYWVTCFAGKPAKSGGTDIAQAYISQEAFPLGMANLLQQARKP